jgi:hypothetical protein
LNSCSAARPAALSDRSTQWLTWLWISAFFAFSIASSTACKNDATSAAWSALFNHHDDLLERSGGMAMILPDRAIMAVDFVDCDA